MSSHYSKILTVQRKTQKQKKNFWQKQEKPLPKMNTKEQERFIKEHVIKYFEQEALI